MKKTFAFVLSALVVAALAVPCTAFASELQAQSVFIKLPGDTFVTVPDGSSIDLSKVIGSSGSTGSKKPAAKLTAAQKQANKAWKKSGLESFGKKHGWSCKKTWTKKSSTKAVRKAHFYYNKGSKQRFMDVIQTTYKKSGKWKTTWKSGQDGKQYSVAGFKNTLKKSGTK